MCRPPSSASLGFSISPFGVVHLAPIISILRCMSRSVGRSASLLMSSTDFLYTSENVVSFPFSLQITAAFTISQNGDR